MAETVHLYLKANNQDIQGESSQRSLERDGRVECVSLGDGQTQQFYTIAIEDGRIESMRQTSEDTLSPAQSVLPPMEEVAFVFHTISWTYMPTGVTHEDSWSNNR